MAIESGKLAVGTFRKHQATAQAGETVANCTVDQRQAGVVEVRRVDDVGEGVYGHSYGVEPVGTIGRDLVAACDIGAIANGAIDDPEAARVVTSSAECHVYRVGGLIDGDTPRQRVR